jgi:RelA/SpoT family protein
MADITDLAGVRVITFFPRTVSEMGELVTEEFQVVERVDHTALLMQQERFGYKSVHFLVHLNEDRLHLPEYARFTGMTAEIQVRTVLQHAWAEIEHDIQYKSATTIPGEIRRRFMALAGMLEVADREFQAIQDSDIELREQARRSVDLGNLEQVEITPDALEAYLNKTIGADYRISPFSYDWGARLLRKLGFTNFRQVDECIKPYNEDVVGRTIYGTRQGQLTRFEALLLAAMGEVFITKHPWADSPWFASRMKEYLDKLRAAEIPIRSYSPADDRKEASTSVGA